MDEIEKRLREGSENCFNHYEAWKTNQKDSKARESLQESIHELRKIASRLNWRYPNATKWRPARSQFLHTVTRNVAANRKTWIWRISKILKITSTITNSAAHARRMAAVAAANMAARAVG